MYLKIWCEKKTFGKVGITCRTSLDLNSEWSTLSTGSLGRQGRARPEFRLSLIPESIVLCCKRNAIEWLIYSVDKNRLNRPKKTNPSADTSGTSLVRWLALLDDGAVGGPTETINSKDPFGRPLDYHKNILDLYFFKKCFS